MNLRWEWQMAKEKAEIRAQSLVAALAPSHLLALLVILAPPPDLRALEEPAVAKDESRDVQMLITVDDALLDDGGRSVKSAAHRLFLELSLSLSDRACKTLPTSECSQRASYSVGPFANSSTLEIVLCLCSPALPSVADGDVVARRGSTLCPCHKLASQCDPPCQTHLQQFASTQVVSKAFRLFLQSLVLAVGARVRGTALDGRDRIRRGL